MARFVEGIVEDQPPVLACVLEGTVGEFPDVFEEDARLPGCPFPTHGERLLEQVFAVDSGPVVDDATHASDPLPEGVSCPGLGEDRIGVDGGELDGDRWILFAADAYFTDRAGPFTTPA